MQKREKFFLVFFIFLFLSVIVLGLSFFGKLSGILPFLEKETSFVPKISYGLFQSLPFVSESRKIKELKEQNLDLIAKLVDQERLRRENAALLDQFQTQKPKVYNLLLAKTVGAPGFIPGVTTPSSLILDKGEKDFVAVGNIVISKNNLVGKVTKVSFYLSKVDLITKPSVAFPAKTMEESSGVVRGAGEDKMTLDNVLSSQNLKIGDLVLAKGDVNLEGIGIPPDLIVGKIKSIERIPTALFQRAEVKSLIDFNNLSIVFILVQPN